MLPPNADSTASRYGRCPSLVLERDWLRTARRRAGSVAGGWRVVRRPDSERRDSGSLKNVAEGSDTAWGWPPSRLRRFGERGRSLGGGPGSPRAFGKTNPLKRRFSASRRPGATRSGSGALQSGGRARLTIRQPAATFRRSATVRLDRREERARAVARSPGRLTRQVIAHTP